MLVYQRILSVEYPLLLDGLAARIARHLCSQSCRVSSTSWDCWYWRPLSSQCCWWKYEWKNTKKNVSFPITVSHSPHVFLPKVPRYPKISQDIPRFVADFWVFGFQTSTFPSAEASPLALMREFRVSWLMVGFVNMARTPGVRGQSMGSRGDFSWDIWTINRCSWVYGIPWYLWDIR